MHIFQSVVGGRRLITASLGVLALMLVAASSPERAFVPIEPASNAKPWTQAPVDDGGPLRFVIVGDRTGTPRSGVFPAAMKQVGWLSPDLTISIGDLIEGYSDDKMQLEKQWNELLGFTQATGGPFFVVPGNHDISNPLAADVWKSRFGPANYAFRFKAALFVVLNSEEMPQILPKTVLDDAHAMTALAEQDPDRYDREMADVLVEKTGTGAKPAKPSELQGILAHLSANYVGIERDRAFSDAQIAWLRDVLSKQPDAAWTFVFVHRPEWRNPASGWKEIEAALAGRKYTVVGGHEHIFRHETRSGADFFQMGTTGGTAQRPGPGLMDHVMMVTLGRNGPIYANIRLNGLMDANGSSGQTRAY